MRSSAKSDKWPDHPRYVIRDVRDSLIRHLGLSAHVRIKDQSYPQGSRFVIVDTHLKLLLPSFGSEEVEWFSRVVDRMNRDIETNYGINPAAPEVEVAKSSDFAGLAAFHHHGGG